MLIYRRFRTFIAGFYGCFVRCEGGEGMAIRARWNLLSSIVRHELIIRDGRVDKRDITRAFFKPGYLSR